MELGIRIRQLRCKANLTQEMLAEQLNVSPQSVSKWENRATMPDIALLPRLAEVFGVSIDDLFDLTADQRLTRIENRLEREETLSGDLFREYEESLTARLAEGGDRARILSLLAELYHHRMESDGRTVSRYAREAIALEPGKKGCQWLLAKAEGAAVWDWNMANRAKVIDFYRDLIRANPDTAGLYCYLIDNLLADRRAAEAKEALAAYERLPDHKAILVPVYRAHIALAEFDEAEADRIVREGMERFGGDGGYLFEAAQYHAGKCEYEEAVRCYEASWAAEEEEKPRFTDALWAIAAIREIEGRYEEAAAAVDRVLACLREEWGMSDEAVVREAEREKQRILARIRP